MGSNYSNSNRRKVLRLLLAVILIVSYISYTLSSHQTSYVSQVRLPITERSTVAQEPTLTDDGSGSQQEPEQSSHEIANQENAGVEPLDPKAQLRYQPSEKVPAVPKEKAPIGKITISFGEPNEVFDRAIRSHELHNKMMGYPQYILRERVMSGLWSKHAYIFSVIVQELSKPEAERLKWVMWLDRDTVLMNPLLRLEDFLPPSKFDDIHLLATNDHNGLNNGVFILRVNIWALKLFHNALAFHHYRPEVKLKYTEQSAMEEMLKMPWYKASTAMVPQHWFNSFMPPPVGKGNLAPYHARPGSLLIHFASDRNGLRPQYMTEWMDIADEQTPEWNVPINETFYPAQFEEYWRRREAGENVNHIIRDLEKKEF